MTTYLIDYNFYLWLAAIISFFLFLTYVCVRNSKNEMYRDEMWVNAFVNAGISPETIEKISHDDDGWFYDGSSTCVAYGGWNDVCNKTETVCSGGEVIGNAQAQAHAIAEAIRNKGVHPKCPLIY